MDSGAELPEHLGVGRDALDCVGGHAGSEDGEQDDDRDAVGNSENDASMSKSALETCGIHLLSSR